MQMPTPHQMDPLTKEQQINSVGSLDVPAHHRIHPPEETQLLVFLISFCQSLPKVSADSGGGPVDLLQNQKLCLLAQLCFTEAEPNHWSISWSISPSFVNKDPETL